MKRQIDENSCHTIGSIVVQIFLWVACICSTLLAILLCLVSLNARPEVRVFDWTITAAFAAGSAWLWHIILRGKDRTTTPESATADEAESRRPFGRYALAMILSAIVFPGSATTMYFASENDWVTTIAVFTFLMALPIFGIMSILRIETRSGANRCSVSSYVADPVSDRRVVFSRSRGSMTFWFVVNGLGLAMLPIFLLILWFGVPNIISNFTWGKLFFLAASVFATGLILWVMKIQYLLFRDRNLPLLILDEEGLHFRRSDSELIPWSEITSVDMTYIRGQPILLLGLQYPERYIDRFNRWFFKDLWLGLLTLKGPESAVINAIRNHPLYRGA